MPLFGKHGVFREGQKDLRLTNPPSATAAQLANLGSAATAASAENFQRIGKLTKKYHAGKIPQVELIFYILFDCYFQNIIGLVYYKGIYFHVFR